MSINLNLTGATTVLDLRNALNSAVIGNKKASSGACFGVRVDENGAEQVSLRSGGRLHKIKCFFNIGDARAENRRMLTHLMAKVLADPHMHGLEEEVKSRFRAIDTNRQISFGTIQSLIHGLEDAGLANHNALEAKFKQGYTLALAGKTRKLPEGLVLDEAGTKAFIGMVVRAYRNELGKGAVSSRTFCDQVDQRFESVISKLVGDRRGTPRANQFLATFFHTFQGCELKDLEKRADRLGELFNQLSTVFVDDASFAVALETVDKMNSDTFSVKGAKAFWPKFAAFCDELSQKDLAEQVENMPDGVINGVGKRLDQVAIALRDVLDDEADRSFYMGGLLPLGIVMAKVTVARMPQAARQALFNKLSQGDALEQLRYCQQVGLKASNSRSVSNRANFLYCLVDELAKTCAAPEERDTFVDKMFDEGLSENAFDARKKEDYLCGEIDIVLNLNEGK